MLGLASISSFHICAINERHVASLGIGPLKWNIAQSYLAVHMLACVAISRMLGKEKQSAKVMACFLVLPVDLFMYCWSSRLTRPSSVVHYLLLAYMP
jgi:hypothetical protein